MTLMFCGIGRLWISGIAELPRQVAFAMLVSGDARLRTAEAGLKKKRMMWCVVASVVIL